MKGLLGVENNEVFGVSYGIGFVGNNEVFGLALAYGIGFVGNNEVFGLALAYGVGFVGNNEVRVGVGFVGNNEVVGLAYGVGFVGTQMLLTGALGIGLFSLPNEHCAFLKVVQVGVLKLVVSVSLELGLFGVFKGTHFLAYGLYTFLV